MGQLLWRGPQRWDPIYFIATAQQLNATMTTDNCFKRMTTHLSAAGLFDVGQPAERPLESSPERPLDASARRCDGLGGRTA